MVLRTTELVSLGGAAAAAVAAVLGGAFYPGQRLVIGLLFALLIGWSASLKRRSAPAAEEWLLLALIGWGAMSAVVVGAAPLAAKEVLTGWLVAWWVWVAARRATPRARSMAAPIMVSAALLVAVGVGCEAFGRGEIRVGGLLENPNIAAALLVGVLPLVGLLPRRRWLRVSVGAVLVGGVVLTGSRAGLLALLAAGVVLIPRGRARIIGMATGAAAVAGLVAWRLASQPEALAWFRPAIWLAVLRLWAAHPILGVGPGGLAEAAGPLRLLHADHVGRHQYLITYAESSPLGLLVQAGVVGLALALVALAIWLRRGGWAGALATPVGRSAAAAMVVMAAFHDFVTIEVVLWWWGLVLGLAEAAARPDVPPAPDAPPDPAPARTMRALAAALVILWGIVQPAWARWLWRSQEPSARSAARAHAAEPWFSAPLEWRVRSLLSEEPWSWERAAEAIALGGEAVRAHPGASRPWLNLGQAQYRTATDLGPWPDAVASARAAFARATALEPLQPWGWLEWARLERGLGRLDEAAALARRAAAVEPNAVAVHLFLARVELDRAQIGQARDALQEAKAAAVLQTRPGLTAYERELLTAPAWQLRELEEALR